MRERIRSEEEKGKTEGETRLGAVDTELKGWPTVLRASDKLGTDWPLRMPVCSSRRTGSPRRPLSLVLFASVCLVAAPLFPNQAQAPAARCALSRPLPVSLSLCLLGLLEAACAS